jgi:hypothetical protein
MREDEIELEPVAQVAAPRGGTGAYANLERDSRPFAGGATP